MKKATKSMVFCLCLLFGLQFLSIKSPAVFAATKMKVTFNANGGKVSPKTKKVTKKKKYGTLPTPTRKNYQFLGWYTKKTAGSLVTKKTVVKQKKNHSIYAHWSGDYKLSFDAMGGNLSTKNKKISYNKPFGQLPQDVTRAGYVFEGWYDSREYINEVTKETILLQGKNMTIYAKWSPLSYQVSFDANGGTMEVYEKTVVFGTTYGSLPQASLDGKVFEGWYTKPEGGELISESTLLSIPENHTLYAQWRERQYTIVFKGMEASEGSMKNMLVNYGERKKLSKNTYTMDACTFIGWSTKRGGEVVYKDEEEIYNLSEQDGEKITLYAVFKGNTSFKDLFKAQFEDYANKNKKWGSLFGTMADTLQLGKEILMPGLSYTNRGDGIVSDNMIPQGMCIAGNYALISAYDGNSKANSVVYVVDKQDKKYYTTLNLGMKSHVGAMAYNPSADVIYICGSSNIYVLSMSKIRTAISSGQDAYNLSSWDYEKVKDVDITPSFLTYYDGKLFVGSFDKTDVSANRMIAYCVEDGSYEKYQIDISLPLKCQGVAFKEYKDDTYLICSSSYGRTNASRLYIYKMVKTDDDRWIEFKTITNENGEIERIGLLGTDGMDGISAPNMSEDMDASIDDYLYVCYESAANTYQYSSSTSTKKAKVGDKIFPLDRVPAYSISKLIEMIVEKEDHPILPEPTQTLSTPNTAVEKISTMGVKPYVLASKSKQKTKDEVSLQSSGSCGQNIEYQLYRDGTLTITGEGKMDDYNKKEVPWKEYLDDIKQVSIGAGVTSIGKEAFLNASNLERVSVSEFSDENKKLKIGEKAFANCDSLDEVRLPEKDFQLGKNCFTADNKELTIVTNSDNLKEYCKEQNLSLHVHDMKYKERVEATCGSYGYDRYECECGAIEYRNKKAPHGKHKFEVLEYKKGNDTDCGSVSYLCKDCGAYYAEDLD